MTDNEIIKALEMCSNVQCKWCPLVKTDYCTQYLTGEALDLIKRQQAEIEKYKDLEEQGKLVLFPRYAYFIKDRKVHKGWVQETVHAISRKPLYDIRYDDKSLANYRGYLGNTVFLTKEEAEAKLKEMKGE